ncbi:lysophospholipid acyltransferase family protein [Planctomycetaceae bacterium SH139]
MSVVVEKPYTFVPPSFGNLWPSLIQRLRLVDWYLRKKEGVVSYECRHLDRLRESLQAGHGILLAPNHCRYADPLVMGWLSREVGRHVFAMASWHLFNKHWFDRFSIPKMGGFSIWREGLDRQSLELAIKILQEARRPLIVFPEGTTNRTNDRVQPLLDGVAFMARTAARRRAKQGAGPVVVHPIAIKYLFRGDIDAWADQALDTIETRLGWRNHSGEAMLSRIARVAEGLLCLKEVEYLRGPQAGDFYQRRDRLMEFLLTSTEDQLKLQHDQQEPVLNRVRACRTRLVGQLLQPETSESAKRHLRDLAARIDIAQQLDAYPADYLSTERATDTRVMETLERMQEGLLGRSTLPCPLHAVIEVAEPLVVKDQRPPRGEVDPFLVELRNSLESMLGRLASEANPVS